MVITNGFMYIAFLMCLAGILLALEKYTKWKIFNVVPPLVWIYVLNMIFCTLGLYHSKEVSAAYKALKNNLLYAMIFVMLLRCDFRKLAKLGGRMVAIFLGCSLTLFVGFIVGYPIFKGSLGSDTWGAVAALYASWVGGSANMAAMQAALPVDAGAYSCALALDTVCYSVWIALLLLMVRYASKWNNAVKADTSKLQAVADAAAAEVAKEKKQAGGADWIFLIGLSLIVSAISQYVGASLNGALRDVGLAMFDKGSMTTLFCNGPGPCLRHDASWQGAGCRGTFQRLSVCSCFPSCFDGFCNGSSGSSYVGGLWVLYPSRSCDPYVLFVKTFSLGSVHGLYSIPC